MSPKSAKLYQQLISAELENRKLLFAQQSNQLVQSSQWKGRMIWKDANGNFIELVHHCVKVFNEFIPYELKQVLFMLYWSA